MYTEREVMALAQTGQNNTASITTLNQQYADIANEIIYETTLTEVTNAVTISTDLLGRAFALKKATLTIICPAGVSSPTGTNALLTGRVNDLATAYYDPGSGSDSATSFSMGALRNLLGASTIEFQTDLGGFTSRAMYLYSDGTTRSASILNAARLSGVDYLNKFYVFLSGGYTFPVGTKIQLRGQRK